MGRGEAMSAPCQPCSDVSARRAGGDSSQLLPRGKAVPLPPLGAPLLELFLGDPLEAVPHPAVDRAPFLVGGTLVEALLVLGEAKLELGRPGLRGFHDSWSS